MPGRGVALLKSIKALEAKSKQEGAEESRKHDEVVDDISKSIVEICKIQEVKYHKIRMLYIPEVLNH